ncbi:MAG: glycosyltransferase [Verrucomicrobiia bacterium]
MTNPVAISVVIRTRDSARTLDQAIGGLGLREPDEVIVVDSGSRDSTLKIAEKRGAKIIIAEGPFNYSKSLNLGFKAAKNPWVLVISSHTIPLVPGFLDVYRGSIAAFADDVVVAYGPNTLTGRSELRQESEGVGLYDREDYRKIEPEVGNGNAIYSRSAWQECPFSESIRTGEDRFWLREMLKRNHRMAYIPAARTVNRNQGSLLYMFRKAYSEARTAERGPDHHPMKLWHLGGALKNLAVKKLRGQIDMGNWLRYSAHTFGQYFGSYGPQNNRPDWK